MPDLRKGYSNLLRPSPVEDLPVPWAEAEGDHNYTVTLFAFAWALLPVGFMPVSYTHLTLPTNSGV